MKNLKLLFSALILLVSLSTFAQSDEFNYQAAIRDASGEIMQNEFVTIVFSIKETTASGTEVYAETHSLNTNDQGLVNVTIGSGTVTAGTFGSINWGNNNHFLNVNINGVDMGTSEFKSVPYANYAENAGNVFSGDYNDLTNVPAPTGSCCGFRASVTSNQQVIPVAVGTKILYSDQNFDPDNVYNYPTSVFTAPSDGFYHFDANIGMSGTDFKYFYIQVNGVSINSVAETNNGYYYMSINLNLSQGDEVTLNAYVFGSPSTVIWNSTGNSFSGYKVY